MLDAIINEPHFVVLSFIESNYSCDIKVIKHLDVVFWSIASSFEFVDVIQRSHEGNKLTGDDPVQVSVFDFFINEFMKFNVILYGNTKNIRFQKPCRLNSITEFGQNHTLKELYFATDCYCSSPHDSKVVKLSPRLP